MFSVALVCPQDNSKSYEQISIKFAGDVREGGTTKNWLDFGDVRADTDEMRVLAHAPAPLGGGLRSPSASSCLCGPMFIGFLDG